MSRASASPAFLAVGFTLLPLLFPAGSPAETRQADAPKVGLALSGGGARGAAHIGVLKVIERHGIPIDYIAGTSFGALVGGLYSVGYTAEEIDGIFAGQDWNSVFSDAPERRLSPLIERKNFRYQGHLAFDGLSPELPTGLWGGQKMTEILNVLTVERMISAGYDFDRLPIPFRAVATDLLTGRSHVFSRGSITEALRASMAIPMLFTPVEKDDMLLVDGGLTNNLPTDIVRSLGADIVIAVDVTSPLLKKDEIRSFLDVIDQSFSVFMSQNVEGNRKLADLILRPDLDGFSYSDYTKIDEIAVRGEEEAERMLGNLENLVAQIPPRTLRPSPPPRPDAVVESIEFHGLENVPEKQLRAEVRTRQGETIDAETLSTDLKRLYATLLFDRVDFNVEHLGENKYRVNYLVREAPRNSLGASIRYDTDYKFVALAEITARQLFNTPSSATISSQFGGFEDHSAGLRYVYHALPSFFVEPKVHLRRRERLDIRGGEQVDTYTDRRVGGQLMFGWTMFKRLEVEVGYRDDRTTISGGTPPNTLEDALHLAGLTLRLNRDTLDAHDYPRSGSTIRLQIDKRIERLGSGVSYSKWSLNTQRYFSPARRYTVQLHAGGGYSRGDIPFYDRFFLGGFNFSEGASRHLVGYQRDEFSVRQMGYAGASVQRLFFSHPLSLAKRGFLTGFYNVAAVSDRNSAPYDFILYHGVGIGLAIDTLLGPVRLTGGWGEQGRFKFYMTLGPSF